MSFVIAAWLGWLGVSLATDWLTAERRFHTSLDEALQQLRRPGVERRALPTGERARYHALLRSREPAVRWQAADDLGRWKDRSLVPALVAAMRDDRGTRRTCLMAQSLGAIGDTNAVPALLEAIHHPRNLDLRVCATHALAAIDDARALAPLIAKAGNPELREDDRVSAILALGDMARPEATATLRQVATTDADKRFRKLAGLALRQIALLQTDDPVPGLVRELNSPVHRLNQSWLVQKLAEHWDARSAAALNQFLSHPAARTAERVQAAALLLHREALKPQTLKQLAASPARNQRWLADYARTFENQRPAGPANARHHLATHGPTIPVNLQ